MIFQEFLHDTCQRGQGVESFHLQVVGHNHTALATNGAQTKTVTQHCSFANTVVEICKGAVIMRSLGYVDWFSLIHVIKQLSAKTSSAVLVNINNGSRSTHRLESGKVVLTGQHWSISSSNTLR